MISMAGQQDHMMHLFGCVTPLHIRVAEQIVCSQALSGGSVLLNPFGFDYHEKHWKQAINGGFSATNNQQSLFHRLRYQSRKAGFYRSFLHRVQETLPSATHYRIYLYHLDDMLGNFLFFSFRPESDRRFFILEDGILNYYDYDRTHDRAHRRRMMGKKCFYRLFGLPFRPYRGYMSGIDREEVICQYVRAPALAVFPQKSQAVTIDRIHYEPIPGSYLIIGQDAYINLYGWPRYRDGIAAMMRFIDSRGSKPRQILYKHHRYGDKSLVAKYLRSLDRPITLNDDPEAIEQMVEAMKPQTILSFTSSALMNIKLALAEELRGRVEIYAFDHYPNPAQPVFEKLGIVVHPCS